ncbi:MAG TPA: two-component regulator propeller domain-containing protein [Bacteroidales bacterium]|nr:two-component regulator propeller domain-containing protein [Bacteroidales bacterium]
MIKPVIKYVFFILFVLAIFSVNAQQYQFKQFSIEEGLSHPFAYTINEDRDGFIWIGTGEGLCRFDGHTFIKSTEDDTLTNGFVVSSFLDSRGTLWFGHNSGQITYYDGVQFRLLNTPKDINSSITDITETENGQLIISTQNNGLLKVEKDFKWLQFTEGLEGAIISSVKAIGNNWLLVGSVDGLKLFNLRENQLTPAFSVKELEYIPVQTIDNAKNPQTFWIGTEDSGFYLLTLKGDKLEGYELLNLGEKYNLAYENIQSLYEDTEGVLWVSTFGKGIFKLKSKEKGNYINADVIQYATTNGLPHNFIKQVFQDWEGNFWIATYGNGIAFSVDEAFTMHYQDLNILQGNIISIAESETHLYLGGENAIAIVNKQTSEIKFIESKNGLPKSKITALYLDINNILWIGTSEKGIYRLNLSNNRLESYFNADNSLGNQVNSLTSNGKLIYAGTKNGVYTFDLKTGQVNLFNTQKGLPHNDIKSIFIDSENVPWIATKSDGIRSLNGDLQYSITGSTNLEFIAITEDSEGNLWAATYGDGLFKFEQDSLFYYSTDNGLKSNYCYSLIADEGRIWVGHRLGMSSIDIKTGEVKAYGKEIGITGDVNYNAVLKSSGGALLTGTTHGMVLFDSSKEKKASHAPRLNFTELNFSDQPVNYHKTVNLPYKIYKLRIGFIGLSYSNPNGIIYQYKLDGYDLEWSDFSSNREVYYPRIEDGNYTFIVKACNTSGQCVEEPLQIKINIKPPFWKTWWFITLSVLVGLALIFWYIKYRERKHKALQEYLENELTARTKEVVAQKEMLEIKNRDITDSINYAQRIQQSILPSINTITEYFSDAFVLYKPRDIVSGDFYWYDMVNDNKFLIVCADSTGHGVPGAFMSMIGTTLIKDICLRTDVNSPSQILERLDNELQNTLNRNLDAERANDGMDILVCEIDIKTYYMRFASAMRPLILYKDNDLQYVKGTKASIGGDPKAEKRFENIGFQLGKGDVIYMFSDGYPDQFGGPRGKKFKLDRVKNMLADVCEKPLIDQSDYIEKTFDDWKGRLQQVDDILFMGVRL